MFMVINAVNGQDELCFTNVGSRFTTSFGFGFNRVPNRSSEPTIDYSIDAIKWNQVKRDGSYGYYEGTNYFVNVSMKTLPRMEVGDVIYLRSKNFSTNAYMLWGGMEKIFISGDFNSMRYQYCQIMNVGRKIDYGQWHTFFYGDIRYNNKNALKDYVYGIDMSSYDPVHDMFEDWHNLSYIQVDFTSWDNQITNWVKGVASHGIFVCPRDLEIKYGVNYIPEKWRVVYLDELKNIHIPESIQDYIKTRWTTGIVSGQNMLFYLTDRTKEGYTLTSVTVKDDNNNTISVQQNGNAYSFIMPDCDVTINATYTPIEYKITCSDYVSTDKSKATVLDKVNITAVDRTSDGYALEQVKINGKIFYDANFEISISDYITDLNIEATYSKIDYTITTTEERTHYIMINSDMYIDDSSALPPLAKAKANVGDKITISFYGWKYHDLVSVTCNGQEVTLSKNSDGACFTMPAENVVIEARWELHKYQIEVGEFVKIDKTEVTDEDIIHFTAVDRTAEGYKFTQFEINNDHKVVYDGDEYWNLTFWSSEVSYPWHYYESKEYPYHCYINKIDAIYTKIDYSITTDNFTTASQREANVGDKITVYVNNRAGYNFVSASYNNEPLLIEDNKATFIMPTENVEIKTIHTPIQYSIIAGDYVTVNQSTATIEDEVSFAIKDRSSEGYQLDRVLVNGKVFTKNSFEMKDYLTNVSIEAVYSKKTYTISSDDFVSVSQYSANFGDKITVQINVRAGYQFVSASYNGQGLSVLNNKADFIMPAENVRIKTTFTPIKYKIVTGDYVSIDKSLATIEDMVSFTTKDRTVDGYKFDKVFVNNVEVSGNSFAMKNYLKDVEINATYVPIQYNIVAGDYVTVNKSTASVIDNVTFSVKDRTTEGYKLDKVFINNVEVAGNSFAMKDYLKNIEIKATYTPIQFNIVTGEYVTVNKSTACVTDDVTFSVKDRTAEGYRLDKLFVNNVEFAGNSFAMKDYLKNIEIKATYTPIEYNIVASEYVTVDKTTATIDDKVAFSVKDKTAEGYKLDKVLVNNVEVSGTSFEMKDYLKDVEITAVYSKIDYPIITDNSVTINKTTANIGDNITITVKEKDGYTPRLIINGEEVKLSGNQYVYTVTSDKIDIKVVYEENKPTPVSEISSVDNLAVSVFPNPAIKGEKFNINIEGSADLNGAEILIYDSMGRMAKRLQNVSNHNEINLASGIYNGVFVNKGVRKTFRIVVR